MDNIIENFFEIAADHGWTHATLERSANNIDLSVAMPFAIPELMDRWLEQSISQLPNPQSLKISGKISELLCGFFLINQKYQAAFKRLTSPCHIIEQRDALLYINKIAYNFASDCWYRIGDQSTDFNFYSKRLILSQIFLLTLPVFARDQSSDIKKTQDFIAARLANAAMIGKIKRKVFGAF